MTGPYAEQTHRQERPGPKTNKNQTSCCFGGIRQSEGKLTPAASLRSTLDLAAACFGGTHSVEWPLHLANVPCALGMLEATTCGRRVSPLLLAHGSRINCESVLKKRPRKIVNKTKTKRWLQSKSGKCDVTLKVPTRSHGLGVR